jgi:phosphate-selective porin OprO/OprP
MKVLPNLLAVAVLSALSAPAFAEVEFDVIGGSEISFEGLLQADYNGFDNDVADLNGSAKDGSDSDSGMRRAELVFKGKGPGMWNWVVGYDATAKKWLDTNVSYKFSADTSMVVGQFKQPISLEELSSTGKNDFISKAMTTNLYGISRRVGLGATTGGESWTLTGSVFTRELTRNNGEGNGFGVRATFAPMHDAGNILHFGIAGVSYNAEDSLADGRTQLRVRPDADLSGKRLVDTGLFTDADKIQTLGLEGAWVHGPVKLQAEYMTNTISRDLHQDFTSDSWYVSGVWTITGETWGYKGGVVTTGLPNNPSTGMWQVGIRYDHADLNDGHFTAPSTVTGVLGGKESNWTVGVNCYLRSNFKLSANYVKVSSERYNSVSHLFVQDDPSILEFRAQLYW